VSLLVDGVTASVTTAFTAFGGSTLTAGAYTLIAFSLSDGSYAIQAVATDGSGNSATSGTLNIVVDTTAPTVSQPDLLASSDTGASSTDNVTSDTTPTFSGTAEAGSEVALLINGSTVGGVYVSATGTYTLTAGSLSAGSYFIQAIARDVAGNAANSPLGLSVVIGASVSSTIVGSSGPDILTGGGSADTISGLAGDDTIRGFSGADLLDGGAGFDVLSGGAGNDVLSGGALVDTL
jgi:Ca2+-binding RTX toxin-like protein